MIANDSCFVHVVNGLKSWNGEGVACPRHSLRFNISPPGPETHLESMDHITLFSFSPYAMLSHRSGDTGES